MTETHLSDNCIIIEWLIAARKVATLVSLIEQKGITFDHDFGYRKAWLLITIFAIHSPILLPAYFKKRRKLGKE